jgi:hypothetical protein
VLDWRHEHVPDQRRELVQERDGEVVAVHDAFGNIVRSGHDAAYETATL